MPPLPEQYAQKLISISNRLTLWVVCLLSLYIFCLNAIALFGLYPALHHHAYGRFDLYLVVYLMLASPTLLWLIYKKPSTRSSQLVYGGIAIMVVVTIIRVMTSREAILQIITSSFVYCLTGIIEEFLWRRVLWRLVKQVTGSEKKSYLYTTLHFVLIHVPYALSRLASPLFLAKVLALGIILGGVRLYTRSIKIPVIIHAAINILART